MAFLKNGRKRVSESKEGQKGNHKQCLPGLGGDSVGDLTAVSSIVHQQQFDVTRGSDEQLSESIRQDVAGLLIRAITNLWESLVASELTTDSRIDTVGSSPGFL
jgi:hypothetical protein